MLFYTFLDNFLIAEAGFHVNGGAQKDDKDPIVVVVPGLTSDSDAAVSFLSLLSPLMKHVLIIISGVFR